MPPARPRHPRCGPKAKIDKLQRKIEEKQAMIAESRQVIKESGPRRVQAGLCWTVAPGRSN